MRYLRDSQPYTSKIVLLKEKIDRGAAIWMQY